METRSQVLLENQRMLYNRTHLRTKYLDDAKSFLESTFDKEQHEDAARKNRLKQKLKERSTYRERQTAPSAEEQDLAGRANELQLNGEEMYQHLDFYSRSLTRHT